ncbi:MAG: hypothetical protein Q9190_003236 [Brigantiaea leucoxantha]
MNDINDRAATSDGYPIPPSSAPERPTERPVTAPVTLSQLIPPKRELPVPKERVKRSAPARQKSKVNNRIAAEVKVGSRKTGTKAKAGANLKATNINTKASSTKQIKANETSLMNFKDSFADTDTGDGRNASLKINEKRPIAEKSTVVVPSDSQNHSYVSKATNTQSGKPENYMDPLANISAEEFMDRLDRWVRRYKNIPVPNHTLSTEDEKLAQYAAMLDDERLAVVDDMILRCLEDPNFHKLAEDVEKSWRRIGLGF